MPIDRTRKLANVGHGAAASEEILRLKEEQDAANRAMLVEHLARTPRPLLFFPEVMLILQLVVVVLNLTLNRSLDCAMRYRVGTLMVGRVSCCTSSSCSRWMYLYYRSQ